MKNFDDFKRIINEANSWDELFADIELDGNDFFDIDFDIEDEEGLALDVEPEQSGDEAEEKARPPKITKKMRNANKVKSKVTKELLGPEGKLRPFVEKIFKYIERAIKKEAANSGVPAANINLDKLTIRR